MKRAMPDEPSEIGRKRLPVPSRLRRALRRTAVAESSMDMRERARLEREVWNKMDRRRRRKAPSGSGSEVLLQSPQGGWYWQPLKRMNDASLKYLARLLGLQETGGTTKPRGVLLAERAKGPRDLPDGVGVAILQRSGGEIDIVYYDLEAGQSQVPKLDGHWISGNISIARHEKYTGPCAGAMTVLYANAINKWGPMLYDVALEVATLKAGGLTPDRRMVSDDAVKVWNFYLNRRYDVDPEQLDNPGGELTPDYKGDDCIQKSAEDDAAVDPKVDSWVDSSLSKFYRKPGAKTLRTLARMGKLRVVGLTLPGAQVRSESIQERLDRPRSEFINLDEKSFLDYLGLGMKPPYIEVQGRRFKILSMLERTWSARGQDGKTYYIYFADEPRIQTGIKPWDKAKYVIIQPSDWAIESNTIRVRRSKVDFELGGARPSKPSGPLKRDPLKAGFAQAAEILKIPPTYREW